MEEHLLELGAAGLPEWRKRKPLTAAQWRKLWAFRDNKDGTYTAKGYRGQFSHAVLPDKVGKFVVSAFDDENSTFNDKLSHGVLRTLTLPASLTAANIRFDLMHNLERIEVAEGCADFFSQDGILYQTKGMTLLRCPKAWKGGLCVVPKHVKSIAPWAFEDCQGLTEVKLPEGLKSIGYNAFSICRNLQELIVPASVTEIGSQLFGSFGLRENFRLRVFAGSYAEEYAKENNLKFEIVE